MVRQVNAFEMAFFRLFGGTTPCPMLKAARRGDVAEVRKLVANGANVNEQDRDGGSPLHWAAGMGHVETTTV